MIIYRVQCSGYKTTALTEKPILRRKLQRSFINSWIIIRTSCYGKRNGSVTCCKESRQHRTYDSGRARRSFHSPLRTVTAGREEWGEEEEVSWMIGLVLSPHSARETNRSCTASRNGACAVRVTSTRRATPTLSRERYPRP